MKVYITKYALTDGIREAEATICESGSMIAVETGHNFPQREYFHGEGRDWHTSKESAVARAEEMRVKALKSLEKKKKNLENLKF